MEFHLTKPKLLSGNQCICIMERAKYIYMPPTKYCRWHKHYDDELQNKIIDNKMMETLRLMYKKYSTISVKD